MSNKFLKLKRFREAIQIYKVAKNKLDDCTSSLGIYGYRIDHIAMKKNNFFAMCKTLGIDPIIQTNYTNWAKYYAHFYYEGIEIYCIYDDEDEYNKYGIKELENRFKELFFETENKEDAFHKLREETLDKNGYNNKSKQPIYWMKSYHDFEKYLNRHSKKQESYESKYNKYIEYKKNFEPLDKDEVTWEEAEEERPNGDYFVPMTFKQWNKAHY